MSEELSELHAEVERLRSVIERNRKSFEKLKAQANEWRDRAIRAEAVVEALKAKTTEDPFNILRQARRR